MPKTKKTVKAWAVVPNKASLQEMGTTYIFNMRLEVFSHGIFPQEYAAQKYCELWNGSVSNGRKKPDSKVVPCTITYTV